LILGLLLNGSAHFLAGDKKAAFKWYFGILVTGLLANLVLALPGMMSFFVSTVLLILFFTLWLIMMKQSYRPVRRIRIPGWIAVLVLSYSLGTGWTFLSRQSVHPFTVPSEAMTPAIIPGDHLIAERITYWFSKPKRGDIIVFSTTSIAHPHVRSDSFYVKRVAGLPGETIQINPPNLIVNGITVKDPAIFAEISSRSNGFMLVNQYMVDKPKLSSPEDKIVLGEQEYLVLGDNTSSSLDGRYFGAIHADQIYGRISRIYWPLSRIGKLE